jgi:hypothetical protein
VHSVVIAAVVILLQSVSVVAVLSAGVLGIVWMSFQAATPTPDDPPGSGTVMRADVTAIWIPQALLDLAQREAGPHDNRSCEELRVRLQRQGLNDAFYALTYRGYQLNGESAEITQVRRVSEMPDHFDEFQVLLAAAAGNRARSEARDFSRTTIHVIPDSLLNADPVEAITELMAPRVVRRKSPHGAVPKLCSDSK